MKNINKITLKPKRKMLAEDYFEGIKKGNRAVLSKAITLVESSNNQHQIIAEELIELCLPFSGNSIRVGVTGVPGVGKSTFIETLGSYLIAEKSKRIAVLAIDPSSQKSSGSILGDKTRMQHLSVHENAFIRPSPSSGTLGGVAKATRASIILCEAAGYDTILIETVGVGQSEIEVKSMVDFFLLLMLAGAGDELQGIKRGIMEIADAVIINKADNDNVNQAKKAVMSYKNAIHLFPPNDNEWTPQVALCSALENKGVDKVWDIIASFVNQTTLNNSLKENREKQSAFWLKDTIKSSLMHLFYTDPKVKAQLIELEATVRQEKISPFKAAKTLLKTFKT